MLEIKLAVWLLLLASIVKRRKRASVRRLFVALLSWLNFAQVKVELVSGAERVLDRGVRALDADMASFNCLIAFGLNSLSSGCSNNLVLADDDLLPKTTILRQIHLRGA